MDSLIAKRYAKALLEIDTLSKDEVLESLKAISDLINSDSKIEEFLKSPLIRDSKKYQALIEPIEDKLNPKLVALFKLMAQKGRLYLIPLLADILAKEIQFESRNFKGIVESNEKLDKSLIKKLEKKLSEYSNAQVKLEALKSDLDGIKVEVSDLGLELNFSRESVKRALLEHIQKAL